MTKLSDPANVKNLMQKSKNNAKKCQTAKVPFKMLNLICLLYTSDAADE